jgi:hypothetical protein
VVHQRGRRTRQEVGTPVKKRSPQPTVTKGPVDGVIEVVEVVEARKALHPSPEVHSAYAEVIWFLEETTSLKNTPGNAHPPRGPGGNFVDLVSSMPN